MLSWDQGCVCCARFRRKLGPSRSKTTSLPMLVRCDERSARTDEMVACGPSTRILQWRHWDADGRSEVDEGSLLRVETMNECCRLLISAAVWRRLWRQRLFENCLYWPTCIRKHPLRWRFTSSVSAVIVFVVEFIFTDARPGLPPRQIWYEAKCLVSRNGFWWQLSLDALQCTPSTVLIVYKASETSRRCVTVRHMPPTQHIFSMFQA